ncbi:hypothetical protein GCM10017044_10750 [Kordiimonas sediminis]|uniref:Terminase n=2 Tax=Kordiimonas sediminis TaxID=1735581 RepID=A0A919E6J6_9PROT|nr:hypothetical protein GCM10017044_10750 [Kordiimonas sediminis]
MPSGTSKDFAPRAAKNRFLKCLERGGSVAAAAKAAGVARSTCYDWRQRDAMFSREWERAVETGTDALEDEAVRRSYEGVDKPVFRGSEIIGHVREYSDAMLMFLLKARRPETFRDSKKSKTTELDLKGIRNELFRKFPASAATGEGSGVSDGADG